MQQSVVLIVSLSRSHTTYILLEYTTQPDYVFDQNSNMHLAEIWRALYLLPIDNNAQENMVMAMYRWKAQITLDNGRTTQEVYIEAQSLPEAKKLILALYSGCRISWGPVQA